MNRLLPILYIVGGFLLGVAFSLVTLSQERRLAQQPLGMRVALKEEQLATELQQSQSDREVVIADTRAECVMATSARLVAASEPPVVALGKSPLLCSALLANISSWRVLLPDQRLIELPKCCQTVRISYGGS